MNITKEEQIKILAMRIANDKGEVDPLKLAEELYKIKEILDFNRKEINFLGKIDLGCISEDWRRKYNLKKRHWWNFFENDEDDDYDWGNRGI